MARTDMEQLVFTMSADISGLKRQLDKAVSESGLSATRIQKNLERASNDNWSQKFGKAIDSTFSRTRLAVLEAGSARVPIFAGALNGLGVAGVAAAAGVGLVAVAFGQARKAMDLADELADTATQLGVTTTLLQEYRYAARLAGAETTDADKAIQGFTETLGLAANGAAKPLKVFKALFGESVDVRNFKSAEEALEATADAIAKLDSEADRQAFASKLGLTPLLPLLRQGAAGISTLREQAHSLGIVLDEDIITKAADAKDKLETMSTVISTQLTVAFADLAPFIADAAGALAGFLSDLSAALPEIQQGARGVGQIIAAYAKGGIIGGVRASVDAARFPPLPADFGMDPDDPANIRMGVNQPPPLGPARAVRRAGGTGLASAGSEGGRAKPKARDLSEFRTAAELASDRQLDELLEAYHRMREVVAREDASLGGFVGVGDDAVSQFAERLGEERDRIRETLAGAIEGGLQAGFEGGLPGVLKFLAQQLQRTMITSLADSLAGGLTQNAGDGVSKLLASLFGGGRAIGGGVKSGRFYEVGEHGKELFAPGVSGTIIPNNALRSAERMSSTHGVRQPAVVQQFYEINGAVMTSDLIAQMNAIGAQAARAGAAGGARLALKAMPGAQARYSALGTT